LKNSIVIPVSALRRIFIGLLVLIAFIVLILIARTQLFRAGIGTLFAPSAAEVIDRSTYQAVFLTGGQVFFGKLAPQGDEWFLLSDVFYLSVPDQQGTPGQLVKRGREIQGPREPMIISARSILFIENLRDDGDVATAIRRFRAGDLPVATPPPATVAPASPPAATATPRPSPTR
jgi:hypothetical protein